MGRKKLVQQVEVLRAIRNAIVHQGVPPTLAELCQTLGVGSPRTVQRYLDELEREGMIERWPGARGIRLRRTSDQGIETVSVPIAGYVTAGSLSLAEENIEGWIQIPVGYTKPKSATYFLLRVTGNSMNRASVEGGTIEDGDLVLVRKQPIADPGDIVVALVDGETTIKRLRQGTNYYILQPDSSDKQYHPIVVENDLEVQGVAIRVLKKGSEIVLDSGENQHTYE